jgi:hypothetical protein
VGIETIVITMLPNTRQLFGYADLIIKNDSPRHHGILTQVSLVLALPLWRHVTDCFPLERNYAADARSKHSLTHDPTWAGKPTLLSGSRSRSRTKVELLSREVA